MAQRVRGENSQFEPAVSYDPTRGGYVAVPINLGGADEQVYLVLFGTGLRYASSPAAVTAKVGGVDAPVTFAGPQSEFVGLDQVNILLPRSLAGRGEVEVRLSVDGQEANPVRVSIR